VSLLPTCKSPRKNNLSDLKLLVYGPPKIGKTTFCSCADGALFFATEPGLNSLEAYQVPIPTWEDFLISGAELSAGNHQFKTLIVDTIDNAFRLCTEHFLKRLGIAHESDLGYGKAYSIINTEFARVLTKLAFLPVGLFLVSHIKVLELDGRTGKYTRIVPNLPDKVRQSVLGMADMILYCDIEMDTGADGKPGFRRVIRTKPSPFYEAGDRTGRLPETIDLNYAAFSDAFNAAVGTSVVTATNTKATTAADK
jgi:hypothetical protein